MALHEFTVSSVYARSAILIASVFCLGGCATVGPQSIAAGRGVYTEVINRTEDEQILNVLVRERYDETFGMVSVPVSPPIFASAPGPRQTSASVVAITMPATWFRSLPASATKRTPPSIMRVTGVMRVKS